MYHRAEQQAGCVTSGKLTYLNPCFLLCENGDNNSVHVRTVVRIKGNNDATCIEVPLTH